ncbi:MAG: class I SAM-dependent methyltransferase [Candidatus Latescibacteria bacterium]|nr:class I SAM-dependent methyltransferase [Candidatus Latescibacterota bacterium]
MTDANYDNPWWPLIYDQWNERGDRQQTHEHEFQFYSMQLAGEAGPVLEAACGTGSILLRLLRQGVDIRGFDCAAGMLAVLRRKAADLGLDDIDRRVCCQDMVDFCYDQSFAAILIPASSFMLLPSQAAQIACLERIRAHLVPGGRLLMNFYIPSLADDLLAHVRPSPSLEEFGEFTHPETGRRISVRFKKIVDLGEQTEHYQWFFTYAGETAVESMTARWIYKEEFQLLLRLAGFSRWQLFGTHDGQPYAGAKEIGTTYWVVDR